MTDIVTRLNRSWDEHKSIHKSIISQTYIWMKERSEAADEITKLRERNANLVKVLTSLIVAVDFSKDPELDAAKAELKENEQ